MRSSPAVLALLPALALASDLQVAQSALPAPFTIVAYGDMRFTDPSRTEPTNPVARRALVAKIASESPDAVLVSGDVPWHGQDAKDYRVFSDETRAWRAANLRVYPALGNHELNGEEAACLENWWSAFAQLRPKRWYSVQFGDLVYLLNLDSSSSLLEGSAQLRWLTSELDHLPPTARFVFVNLHHPPISDFQKHGDDNHNVRPNEGGLSALFARYSATRRLRFIVTAGHVHNYERFLESGNVYLVSGGGGAKPRAVARDQRDLYTGGTYPNFHYLKFVVTALGLEASMTRLETPNVATPTWRVRDQFQIPAP